MSRPKSKSELLQLSKANFEKLFITIQSLDKDVQEMEFPEGTLNRNIRDVLAHLHHWHEMFIGWYEVGMSGNKPDMPAKGYSWKDTPELNILINQKYQNMSLANAKANLFESFERVESIIIEHTNEELFEKKRYKWTGSTSLGAYLISATSSHYDWANKLIKRLTK